MSGNTSPYPDPTPASSGPLPSAGTTSGLSLGAKVAIGLGGTLGVLAAGAIALAALLPQPVQPQEVLPDNTLAVAVVDLDPSLGQKVNLVRLLSSLPETDTFDSNNFDPDDPISALITDPKAKARWDQISPWIGNKYAIALLPDKSGDLTGLVALQVQDEAQARVWLDAESNDLLTDTANQIGIDAPEKLEYAFRDGYALVSTDKYVVDRAATTDTVLAQDAQFAQDRAELGDQLIWGWANAGEILPIVQDTIEENLEDFIFAPDLTALDSVDGRLMFGISAQPSDLEFTLVSQDFNVKQLYDLGDLQLLGDSPLGQDVPGSAALGVGWGGISLDLDSLSSDIETLDIDVSTAEKIAATPTSVYFVDVEDDIVAVMRVPQDAQNLLTPGLDATGLPYTTITTDDYFWVGLSERELTQDELQKYIEPGGTAQEIANSAAPGGLTSFIDFTRLNDLTGNSWEPGSTATLSVSTGPDRGDARITQRFSFNTLIGATESTGPGGTIQQNLVESALTADAQAIVRNTNAIAASSMAGGADAQQYDLDDAIWEALGDPPADGYTVSNLGSGDNPSATLSLTDNGVTCTVTIGKTDPNNDPVEILGKVTC